ncbi:MAG: twin-arginine translocation signal domain-containing protein [Candidatus Rokubacteria bacterium]|nr:twin-arginine translocation signal domain-containing protein [Candidatus Rokubacteria bacterium]
MISRRDFLSATTRAGVAAVGAGGRHDGQAGDGRRTWRAT